MFGPKDTAELRERLKAFPMSDIATKSGIAVEDVVRFMDGDTHTQMDLRTFFPLYYASHTLGSDSSPADCACPACESVRALAARTARPFQGIIMVHTVNLDRDKKPEQQKTETKRTWSRAQLVAVGFIVLAGMICLGASVYLGLHDRPGQAAAMVALAMVWFIITKPFVLEGQP